MSRFRFIFACLLMELLCAAGWAQAPFVTDDAGVAELHKWHIEFNNEYDVLKHSDLPNLRQNTANFKISYGVWKNVELGFDNQLLSISSARNPVYPDAVFGYGDMDLSAKWYIAEEKGWRPGLGASLNIELPTGDERRQLGLKISDIVVH